MAGSGEGRTTGFSGRGAQWAPRQAAIKDYFLIGNLHTAALVSRRGAIDWLCLPHFDSPSLFGSLIDAGAGGTFAVHAPGYRAEAGYAGETAIVETTFRRGKRQFSVRDFMLPLPRIHTSAHFLVRKIRSTGSVPVTVQLLFNPRPDYGATTPQVSYRGRMIRLRTSRDNYVRLHLPTGTRVHRSKEGWHLSLRLAEAEEAVFVLEHTKRPRSQYRGQDLEAPTVTFWERWVAEGNFFDYHRSELVRSAITLKLMQFYPTGAIVAAPTTSLPEELGGNRNWDYRYVWIRDATFLLYALYVLGYTNEAKRFFRFIERVVRHCAQCEVELHLFYTIWGHRVPRERPLEHATGYRGATPVRVGNDATDQFQLDIFGSLIDAHYFMSSRGLSVSRASRAIIIDLVDDISERWQQPDNGIWEMRIGAQHYTYSKVMAWVGVNRALRMAQRLRISRRRIAQWTQLEQEIREWILQYCMEQQRQVLTQHADTDVLDASNFLVVLLQFFAKDDPLARSVIAATRQGLSYRDIFVYRYRAEDGLTGDEGAFVLCTFWMIAALAYIGDIEEAERLFKKFTKYIAPSGLMAEEIDPKTSGYLGNHPQAFSHIGYIVSAYHIFLSREK